MISMVRKLLEHFMEKNAKKTNQKEIRTEKLNTKRKQAICQMERI